MSPTSYQTAPPRTSIVAKNPDIVNERGGNGRSWPDLGALLAGDDDDSEKLSFVAPPERAAGSRFTAGVSPSLVRAKDGSLVLYVFPRCLALTRRPLSLPRLVLLS